MIICGIDEAGRGCFAGPVFAGCVILSDDFPISLLNDSKKLSAKNRKIAFDKIMKTCIVGYASVSEVEIDKINILNASLKAMTLAYENMCTNKQAKADIAYVDGNKAPNLPIKLETVVKGDTKIVQIMAASIVAKVMRDEYMDNLDKIDNRYGFAKHKGYGTVDHMLAIEKHGYSDNHRKTFIFKKHKA